MRKQKKSVVFFLFDILRTCFLKKLHTELQCCKVLARARSACQCLRTSCWTLKTSKRRPAAPSLHTEAHDVILYHEDGTTHAHRGGEKKKAKASRSGTAAVYVCVSSSRREREWTGSSTSAFSIQHLLRTRVGTRSTTPSPYSPPLLPPLQNVRGQWLWESFKKIQTRLSRGAEW